MISFKNDYSEGCHPSILKILSDNNMQQEAGYGDDSISNKAKELILKEVNSSSSEVYFVSGGTQANLLVIAATLRPHESVIAANTGHINTHEAGAIEATGHKINSIETIDGKISGADVQDFLDEYTNPPHMVKPRMVYISNTTEVGTHYTKSEIEELSKVCRGNDLYLFVDGARLGSALTVDSNDLSLEDLGQLTDVFYIGGTKNGAMLGEAIVINNVELQIDFPFHLKQHGALMSKGRTLGAQFLALFTDNLFFDLARHANLMAAKLAGAFAAKDYGFLVESSSNQIFPILPNGEIERLEKKYGFYIWEKIDNENSAIRIVTSWATTIESVDSFIADI